MSSKASLECRHISLAYGATPVLRDVNLKIEPGEFFALLGPPARASPRFCA
jgi:iron(III) transport system ATP-binding protein